MVGTHGWRTSRRRSIAASWCIQTTLLYLRMGAVQCTAAILGIVPFPQICKVIHAVQYLARLLDNDLSRHRTCRSMRSAMCLLSESCSGSV
jgi:hypothetical protein